MLFIEISGSQGGQYEDFCLGIQSRVVSEYTDVSEVNTASIIRAMNESP
jgi:hypothetical protein